MISQEEWSLTISLRLGRRGRGNGTTEHELRFKWPSLDRRRDIGAAFAQVWAIVQAIPRANNSVRAAHEPLHRYLGAPDLPRQREQGEGQRGAVTTSQRG